MMTPKPSESEKNAWESAALNVCAVIIVEIGVEKKGEAFAPPRAASASGRRGQAGSRNSAGIRSLHQRSMPS